MLYYLLFAVPLAVAAGILASKRGRSAFAWGLLAVLFSPIIAFVFLLVLDDLSISQVRPWVAAINEQPKLKACPFCAERIQVAAIVCRYCSRELSAPVVADAADDTLRKEEHPPAESEEEVMRRFGINKFGGVYHYRRHRFVELPDAVATARRELAKKLLDEGL